MDCSLALDQLCLRLGRARWSIEAVQAVPLVAIIVVSDVYNTTGMNTTVPVNEEFKAGQTSIFQKLTDEHLRDDLAYL